MKIIEFKKVSEVLAKEHRITIEEGRGWAANIKDRKVFYVKNDVYNLPEDHILGFLLHEIAHIHYTTETKTPEKNKELHHSTMNMLEDIAIENIISKDYPNAGQILTSTKEEVLDTLVKMLPKMEKASEHEKALLYAAARFEDRGYAIGKSNYEIVGNKIVKVMNKDKNKILEREETKDLIPMVNEIIKILLKELGDLSDEEKNQMQKESKNGNASKDSSGEKAKQKIRDKLKAATGWKESTIITSGHIEFIDKITDQAKMIGKRIRSVLKRNNAMEFGGRYRTGKLMAKRFVRIITMKDRNPFARRIVKSNQSYAFAIASDISGSMMGEGTSEDSPMSYAMSSMYMVAEALHYASVQRALVIFGQEAVTVSPMTKEKINWEELIDIKKIRKAQDGGTDISRAMNNCTIELEKAVTERKIMIILTDGSSDPDRIKEEHEKATKLGIECLAITLGNYGCLDFIFKKKNRTIEDTKDTDLIGTAFIDILNQTIKKSL